MKWNSSVFDIEDFEKMLRRKILGRGVESNSSSFLKHLEISKANSNPERTTYSKNSCLTEFKYLKTSMTSVWPYKRYLRSMKSRNQNWRSIWIRCVILFPTFLFQNNVCPFTPAELHKWKQFKTLLHEWNEKWRLSSRYISNYKSMTQERISKFILCAQFLKRSSICLTSSVKRWQRMVIDQMSKRIESSFESSSNYSSIKIVDSSGLMRPPSILELSSFILGLKRRSMIQFMSFLMDQLHQRYAQWQIRE